MRAWMDEWQHASYGDELTEGAEVTLRLAALDAPWLDGAFGRGFVAGLAGAAETQDPSRVVRIVTGTVRRVEAAACSYEARADDPETYAVVPRSGTLTPVASTEDASSAVRHGSTLVGFVVELTGVRDR